MLEVYETKVNYELPIAGRLWVFPKVELVKDPDGRIAISLATLRVMRRAVANIICGEPREFTVEEFDFLVSITRSKFSALADVVCCEPTAISNWRKRGRIPKLESLVLKKHFWMQIFGKELGSRPSRADSLAGELSELTETAVKEHLAIEIHPKVA